MVSEWGAGCLALRAAILVSLCSTTESSKQAKRTAPLKSPSSSLIEPREAKDRSGADWPWDLGGGVSIGYRVVQGCMVTFLSQQLINQSSQVPTSSSSSWNPEALFGEVQQPHPSTLIVAPVNVFQNCRELNRRVIAGRLR